MKVLVTGGAGFIGSHVVDRLLLEKHEVLCIDNFDDFYAVTEKKEHIKEHFPNSKYSLLEGSVSDRNFIKNAVKSFNADCIIHLAARPGVRQSINNPDIYFQVNTLGTLSLLEAIKDNPPNKLIHASSSSVYGLNERIPFSESDSTLSVASPYAASKVAGEAVCRAYSHLYNINTTVLRFFTVYGSRQRPDLAIRKFIENILLGKEITIYGDGSSSRDYTHVLDIVSGIFKSMNYFDAEHSIFNIGSSMPYTVTEIISQIEMITGKKATVKYIDSQQGDLDSTYADISKAKAILGYNPQMNIEKGVTEMVHWVQSYLK